MVNEKKKGIKCVKREYNRKPPIIKHGNLNSSPPVIKYDNLNIDELGVRTQELYNKFCYLEKTILKLLYVLDEKFQNNNTNYDLLTSSNMIFNVREPE